MECSPSIVWMLEFISKLTPIWQLSVPFSHQKELLLHSVEIRKDCSTTVIVVSVGRIVHYNLHSCTQILSFKEKTPSSSSALFTAA
jgi:hypothetical protein